MNTLVHISTGRCQLKAQHSQALYYVVVLNIKCKDHKIQFNIGVWKLKKYQLFSWL